MGAELVKGERAPHEKTPHSDVGYESPSSDPRKHCSLCKHYIPARVPRCQTVKSPIHAKAWCERFEFED